jgi:uncharacterized protein (TIGR00255 family)
MKSMTGHGRGEIVAKGMRVVVECFSVNRKQGEVSLAAGREWQWMEPHVREDVLKRVSRGKVQVSVVFERAEGSASGLIDHQRAAAFLKEARLLQKKLGLTEGITLETILAAPGVVRADGEVDREVLPLVQKALAKSLDALLDMRAREGANLKKELKRVLTRMSAIVKRVRTLAPNVPKRQRENLLKRLEGANLPVDVLEPRLATEIAIFAERCDISEELARLESHLGQFGEALDTDGPVGRTMEFLAQEMGREWNTTGAKANDAAISRLVVEAKAELDRIREQLANIE